MATTGHESEVIDVQGLASAMAKAMNLGISNKGTCTTAAGTAAKTVQVGDGFSLSTGAMVLVTFQNAISVAPATLNVNGKSAKPIYYRGAALGAGMVKAGATVMLRYNGTQFEVVGDIDTVYSAATSDAEGLMSAADKAAVDGVSLLSPVIKANRMTSASARWTFFASVDAGTVSRYDDLVVLVQGLGYYYNGQNTGSWIVECRSAYNNGTDPNTIRMTATNLSPKGDSGIVTFGYYTDTEAGKVYFGVYTSSRHHYIQIIPLFRQNIEVLATRVELTEAPATWTAATMRNYEDAASRVTDIDSGSTDSQYPSAKCVYDWVKILADKKQMAEQLGGASDEATGYTCGLGHNVFIVTQYFTSAGSSRVRMYSEGKFDRSELSNVIGVGVVEGNHRFIIDLDDIQEAETYWSLTAKSGGTEYITSVDGALGDFDGETKTATIVATIGADALAANACAQKSKTITIGDNSKTWDAWYLPAIGELQMISNHLGDINRCLVKAGGTPIKNDSYWSSTEYSSTNAWFKSMSTGLVHNYTKSTYTRRVRALAAF